MDDRPPDEFLTAVEGLRDALRQNQEAMTGLLASVRRNDELTQQLLARSHMTTELVVTALSHVMAREPLPPALLARGYRLLTEPESPELLREAERHRAYLHEQAEAGNERATEVLDLLSDDPFWREP